MAEVRLADIIEPAEFTAYIVASSLVKSAFYQSGVTVVNGQIQSQLTAGAHSFTVPFWLDLADDEANIVNDDPSDLSTPHKIGTNKQVVRKSFLHNSWSAMNLASEIAGSDALSRIQNRVAAYWARQMQSRLIASLNGVLADNVANDSSDMVVDVAAEATGSQSAATKMSVTNVIAAAYTLGDAMRDVTAMAVHSAVYQHMLTNDVIETIPDSKGGHIQLYRGMLLIVDDGLPSRAGTTSGVVYTSVLFGASAVGVATAAPKIAEGTEIENLPSAGKGGGQQVLHSRLSMGIHPVGFSFIEGSVADESPSQAELALAGNWDRIIERRAVPMAFLISN